MRRDRAQAVRRQGRAALAIALMLLAGVTIDPARPRAAQALTADALIEAVRLGRIDAVRALLAAGADVNATDARGTTALMAVAGQARADIIRTLLAAGADPNARDPYGMTALMLAAQVRQLDNMRALLAAGADPNARSANGLVYPLGAAVLSRYALAVQLLLDARAHPNLADIDGVTPLMVAAGTG